MSQEKALELVKEWLVAQKSKPSPVIALICAAAWVITVCMVGKSALLLAIPITFLAIIKAGQ